MQLLIALAASAAALKPNNRLDAAAVTLDRPVAPLPTFAPLPAVADAPEKMLDIPDLPLRRAALREWSAENNRVECLGEKIEIKNFLSHEMAHEARMQDMSRIPAPDGCAIAVYRVMAERLLHEPCSCSANLPGGNLVDGLPPVVN